MTRTIPNARRTCTQRGCHLSILVVPTYTSSETKATSRHKSLLSGSFQQVSRVGLTPQILGTALSDEDGRNRHQATFAKTGSILPGTKKRCCMVQCPTQLLRTTERRVQCSARR